MIMLRSSIVQDGVHPLPDLSLFEYFPIEFSQVVLCEAVTRQEFVDLIIDIMHQRRLLGVEVLVAELIN